MKLCTCNHCGKIYEDMNPKSDAKEFPDHDAIEPLIKLFEDPKNGETGYLACPECLTDSFLSDDVSQEHYDQIFK